MTLSLTDVATGHPDVQGEVGEQVTLRVTVSNAASLVGLEFELRFDPSVVAVGGVQQRDVPGGFFFISNTDNVAGIVKMVLAGALASGTANINLAEVAFDLIGSRSSSAEVRFTEVIGVADPNTVVEVVSTDAIINILPILTPTPTPPPTASPTPTDSPASTAMLSPTLTPTGTPTATPTDTPTAAPTSTPHCSPNWRTHCKANGDSERHCEVHKHTHSRAESQSDALRNSAPG